MHRSTSTLAILLALLATPACLGTGHSVNVYGGARSLGNSDFNDVENHTVYGADAVLKLELPWLAVETGYLHSDDSSGAVKLDVDEYFVGLRATPWTILIEPYFGAGVTYIDGDLDTGTGSDSDGSLALYGRVGAAITLGLIRLGLDGRATTGSDVTLDSASTDIDNYQITAFIGVGL